MPRVKRQPGDLVRLPSGHISALICRFHGRWVAALARRGRPMTRDDVRQAATSRGRREPLAVAMDTWSGLPDSLVGSSRLWGRLDDGGHALRLAWRAFNGASLTASERDTVQPLVRRGDAPDISGALEESREYCEAVASHIAIAAKGVGHAQ